VHLDGVEGVEELDAVELEDEFAQDLLAEEGGLASAVEEDDAEESVGLATRHFRHEQLEVVDVELAVQQFLLAWRVLPPRYLAHVLLTAHLATRLILRTVVLQDQLKLALAALPYQLLQTHLLPRAAAQPSYLRLQVERASDQAAQGCGFGAGGEDEFSTGLAVD
jgi:hypothetical protein